MRLFVLGKLARLLSQGFLQTRRVNDAGMPALAQAEGANAPTLGAGRQRRMAPVHPGLRALFCTILLAAIPAEALAVTTTTLAVLSGGSAVTTVPSSSAVTLKATVLEGATPVTTGQVNFCDASASYCTDIHLLGVAQLTSAGTAVIRFVPGVGSHSYKAVFVGTTSEAASASAPAALAVTGTAPTTTLIGADASTATVAGWGSAAPTGEISFLDTSNANALLGTASLSPGIAGLGFLNAFSLGAMESDPAGIATGDFNGDGVLDLAICNGSSSQITVLLGDGKGSFATTAVNLSAGTITTINAVGDFNQDGIADLVATGLSNDGNNLVLVFLGNGDGSFAAAPIIETGTFLNFVAVADFNRDGIPDLALTSPDTDTVALLLGNGDGSFAAVAASPVTGSSPSSLVAGDFNGDGIADLAVANFDSNTLTVLLGNGDGSFTAAASPQTGTQPEALVTGDFNGDGILDLAVANYGSDTLTVLLGNGDGSFTAAASPQTSSEPDAVTTGDFNGDGILDLAVANYNQRGVYDSPTVLLGDGHGSFAAVPTNPASTGAQSVAIAGGDFNGDGISDLAVVDYFGDDVAVFLGVNQTATATSAGITVPVATGTHQVVASYAGDGHYKASISAPVSVTAAQGAPTVRVTASPNPAPYGSAVILTATVTGTGLTPTGMVTFSTGSGQLGTGTLNSAGVATFAESALTIGSYSVTASYVGDTNYTAATSSAFSLTVNKGTPTSSLTLAANPVTLGTAATLTVTLTGGSVAPTGTVTFLDGSTALGTATLSKGVATYSTAALALGSHTLTASYGGDSNYAAVTSPAATLLVSNGSSSSVTVNPAAAQITDEQSVAVSVTVAGASGQAAPTGLVTLTSGSYLAQQTLGSGMASFTLPAGSLSSGANVLTAAYAGDVTYASSTGTATVTLSQAVIVVPAPPSISAGASATATATLMAGSSYSGTMHLSCTLTGSPTGAQSLPTCNLNPANVVLTAGGSGSTILTVTTTAATSSALVRPSPWNLAGAGAALAGLFMLVIPMRLRRTFSMLALLLAVVVAGAIGCGGGSTSVPTKPTTPATTAGSYIFTVAGADTVNSNITVAANVTVTVQ